MIAFLAAIWTAAGAIGFTAPECYDAQNNVVPCDAYRFERNVGQGWTPATGWRDDLNAALTPSAPGAPERVRFSVTSLPVTTHFRVFSQKGALESEPSNLLAVRASAVDTLHYFARPRDTRQWRYPQAGAVIFAQQVWDETPCMIESQSEVQWRLRDVLCRIYGYWMSAGEVQPCQ